MPRYARLLASSAFLLLAGSNVASLAQDAFDELDAASGAVDSFTNTTDQSKQQGNEFQTWKSKRVQEQIAWENKLKEELSAYRQIYREEAGKHTRALSRYWDDPETSSKKVWIDYSEDLTQKNRVDFENHSIALSTAMDKKAQLSDAEMRASLKALVSKNRAQAFREDVISQAVEKRSKATMSTLVTAQVEPTAILIPYLTGKEKLSDKEVEQIVDHMLQDKKVTTTINKKGQKVVTVEVPLSAPQQLVEPVIPTAKPPEVQAVTAAKVAASRAEESKQASQSTTKQTESALAEKTPALPKPVELREPIALPQVDRAEHKHRLVTAVPKALPTPAKTYAPSVYTNAEKNKMDDALIWAIIETESAFNPMAKSGVPAYGLMQIVPSSAGQDATKQLFGKARILSPSYLYNSANNIEIGSTYLYILYYRYLKDVDHPVSRMYCAIAAYNTGAGNVARAFTGKRRISPAVDKINRMTPRQVYDHLVLNLPYEETRRYLQKVNKRMPKYRI